MKMIPCTIFAISAYKEESITFAITLDEGSTFYYIPPHKISIYKQKPLFELKDIVYNNCESEIITIKEFKFLGKKPISIYLKNKDIWVEGKYILTIDWYKGNDLVHMIQINTGEFCFMPSHKLKFNGAKLKFKKFKKCTLLGRFNLPFIIMNNHNQNHENDKHHYIFDP